MYDEVFRDAGLSLNEAKVYAALLHNGGSSVQAAAIKANVHRRNAYDSLAKLQKKGLVSEVFIDGEKHFRPTDPRRLLELLQEREEKLNKVLPELEAQYKANEPEEQAYTYKGIEGFKNYLQDILDTKETVYFIGAKAFWLDPRLQHFLPRFQRERKRLGIRFVHLFDQEVKRQKPEILKLVGKPYRFLPKEYSSAMAIDIFGPYVVTFVGVKTGALGEEPVQFVMKSRKLADGYRTLFKFLWEHANRS